MKTVVHLKINKFFLRLLTYIFIGLTFLTCTSQKSNHKLMNNAQIEMSGRYIKVNGTELLILNDDKSFLYLRNKFQKSDVVVPLCDTLAKGFWEMRNTFITLKNKNDFNKIDYSISESAIKNKDSIYIKIIFPKEDANSYKIFNYTLITSPMYGQIHESIKPEFAILAKGENIIYSLFMKNIAPNCDYGVKCYQRIYFKIFENYKPQSSSSNFFTITIKNFNQCFYEAMDINGEVIGIENHSLFWRESEYRLIK